MLKQNTHKRLVIALTDGDLSGRIDIEDLALCAKRLSIDLFCIGVGVSDEILLKRKFGPKKVLYVEDIKSLPEEMGGL